MGSPASWISAGLLWLASSGLVWAAEFSCHFGQDEYFATKGDRWPYGGYAVDMEGPILQGDAQKLEAFLDQLSVEDCSTTGPQDFEFEATMKGDRVIRLNSGGGALAAAIELGRVFRERHIRTEILAGQECLSACAVAFMSGHIGWFEVGTEPMRSLHAGGRIGFHRPYLEGSVIALSEEVIAVLSAAELEQLVNSEVQSSFDAANAVLREMIAGDPLAWDPDLLVRMLTAAGRDDAGNQHYVSPETVGDLVRWGIDLKLPSRPELTNDQFMRSVINHCHNAKGEGFRRALSWSTPFETYSVLCQGQDCDAGRLTLVSGDVLGKLDVEDYDPVSRLQAVADPVNEQGLEFSVLMDEMNGTGCEVHAFDINGTVFIDIDDERWPWDGLHGFDPRLSLNVLMAASLKAANP